MATAAAEEHKLTQITRTEAAVTHQPHLSGPSLAIEGGRCCCLFNVLVVA